MRNGEWGMGKGNLILFFALEKRNGHSVLLTLYLYSVHITGERSRKSIINSYPNIFGFLHNIDFS